MSMSHLVSLNVGVSSPETHKDVYELLSRLGEELVLDNDYVSVTSATSDSAETLEDNLVTGCLEEHLYYDENTLEKVRDVLREVATENGRLDVTSYAEDIIHAMQNAGIIFRERLG